VTQSFCEAIVNAAIESSLAKKQQHQAAYQGFSAMRRAHEQLSPELRYLLKKVTVHHSRMLGLHEWDNAGEYFAVAADSGLMNYELVANETFLNGIMLKDPPNSLTI